MSAHSFPPPETVDRATPFGEIVQLAYHAPDIAKAAEHWRRECGAGPFYLTEHIMLSRCLIDGVPAQFDHSSAYGWRNDLMIELIHQHDDAPSPVRAMFHAQSPGLHHAAIFVDDLGAAIAKAERCGMALRLDATTVEGVRFALLDARADYGFMLEFYEPVAALRRFYAFVARKADEASDGPALRFLRS